MGIGRIPHRASKFGSIARRIPHRIAKARVKAPVRMAAIAPGPKGRGVRGPARGRSTTTARPRPHPGEERGPSVTTRIASCLLSLIQSGRRVASAHPRRCAAVCHHVFPIGRDGQAHTQDGERGQDHEIPPIECSAAGMIHGRDSGRSEYRQEMLEDRTHQVPGPVGDPEQAECTPCAIDPAPLRAPRVRPATGRARHPARIPGKARSPRTTGR